MNYSKNQIEKYASESNFIKANIEKVMRLMDVLSFIFERSSFKDKLVLKGGTAINLVHTNLKRLSVDIDLDYCGSIDRKIALLDRTRLSNELDEFMIESGYEISPKSRGSVALFSRVYKFVNAFGGNDSIKVDINFMDRIHLFEIRNDTISYFDKTVTIKTPSIEELFGMKICALINRSKPRDLYDSLFILENNSLFNEDPLRKAIIFYLSINGKFEINDKSFSRIQTITSKDIKKELLPVIKKNERFNLDEVVSNVNKMLRDLLVLDKDESQYLNEFSKGNFVPNLLFDDETSKRAERHPMAKWIILNIKNNLN